MDKFGDLINWILPRLSWAAEALGQLAGNLLRSIPYAVSWLFQNHIGIAEFYCQMVRWVMPILALMILTSILRSMIRVKNPKERWGYLYSPELGRFPVTHWETLIGKGRNCDIIVPFMTISKVHCALIFDGVKKWRLHNLTDRADVSVNGVSIDGYREIESGDSLTIGGVNMEFQTISQKEAAVQEQRRAFLSQSTIAPLVSTCLLTVFQMLTVSSLIINRPEHSGTIATSFLIFTAVMWGYILFNYLGSKTGLEPEILAFSCVPSAWP
ncbi:MAG: FHA domain-containing protein [Firmicutes bacterium]|nr:FHA domain-containing protein [Bacillota bacterium]